MRPFSIGPRDDARSRPVRQAKKIAIAVSAALAASLAAVAPAGAASVYYGALVDGQAPSAGAFASGGAFYQHEQQSGKKLSMVHWGQPWKMNGQMQPFQRSYFDNVRAHGSIPVLNWASHELGKGLDQPAFQLRDIYGGTYDAFIRQWATDAKNWGHPFMLRFNHEMNGWWYPWGEGKTSTGAIANGNSPGDYVKAWRHVHAIFESVGATNVTWLWAPNLVSNPIGRQAPLTQVYPGSAYVDWTGLSAYNKASSWLTPTQLLTGSGTNYLANTYSLLQQVAPGKPINFAETASLEAGDGGAKKAAWITELLTRIPTDFPAIKAVMYFDWQETSTKTYPIDSSAAVTTAFRSGIASPVWATNSYSAIRTSPIPTADGAATGTTTGSTTLTATADTYTDGTTTSAAGGTAKTLHVDASPKRTVYLKFNLTGVAGKTLTSARLKVHTTADPSAGSAGSQDVRLVSNTSWTESSLTGATAPALGTTTIGSVPGGSAASTWYTITLDRATIQSKVGGQLSLAIRTSSSDGWMVSSRESTAKPQLVLGY